MASMRFDRSTVVEMMSLVDEHRDELKEADYVKICNAMRYLHQRTQETPRTPPTPTPQAAPQMPAHMQSPFYRGHMTDHEYLQRDIHFVEQRIHSKEYSIRMNQSTLIRTVNLHRQQVIVELMPDVARYRGRSLVKMKTDEIRRHTQTLIDSRLITSLRDMKTRADQKKCEDCQSRIDRLEQDIRELQGTLEELRERLQSTLAN